MFHPRVFSTRDKISAILRSRLIRHSDGGHFAGHPRKTLCPRLPPSRTVKAAREEVQEADSTGQTHLTDPAPKKCNTPSHPFRKKRGMDGAQRFKTSGPDQKSLRKRPASLASQCFQAVRGRPILIHFQSLNTAKFRPFRGHFRPFSGKTPPLFGKKPLFSGRPFLTLW